MERSHGSEATLCVSRRKPHIFLAAVLEELDGQERMVEGNILTRTMLPKWAQEHVHLHAQDSWVLDTLMEKDAGTAPRRKTGRYAWRSAPLRGRLG